MAACAVAGTVAVWLTPGTAAVRLSAGERRVGRARNGGAAFPRGTAGCHPRGRREDFVGDGGSVERGTAAVRWGRWRPKPVGSGGSHGGWRRSGPDWERRPGRKTAGTAGSGPAAVGTAGEFAGAPGDGGSVGLEERRLREMLRWERRQLRDLGTAG